MAIYRAFVDKISENVEKMQAEEAQILSFQQQADVATGEDKKTLTGRLKNAQKRLKKYVTRLNLAPGKEGELYAKDEAGHPITKNGVPPAEDLKVQQQAMKYYGKVEGDPDRPDSPALHGFYLTLDDLSKYMEKFGGRVPSDPKKLGPLVDMLKSAIKTEISYMLGAKEKARPEIEKKHWPMRGIKRHGERAFEILSSLEDVTRFYLGLEEEMGEEAEFISPEEAYKAMKEKGIKIIPGDEWQDAFEMVALENIRRKVDTGEAMNQQERKVYKAWQDLHKEMEKASIEKTGYGIQGTNYDSAMRQVSIELQAIKKEKEGEAELTLVDPGRIRNIMDKVERTGVSPESLRRGEREMGPTERRFMAMWNRLEQAYKERDPRKQFELLYGPIAGEEPGAFGRLEPMAQRGLAGYAEPPKAPWTEPSKSWRPDVRPRQPQEECRLYEAEEREEGWDIPPEKLIAPDHVHELLKARGVVIMTPEDVEKEIVKRAHERIRMGQIVLKPEKWGEVKGAKTFLQRYVTDKKAGKLDDPFWTKERVQKAEWMDDIYKVKDAMKKASFRQVGDALTAIGIGSLKAGASKRMSGQILDDAIEDAGSLFHTALMRGEPLPATTFPSTEKTESDPDKIAAYKNDPELMADEILLPICREVTSLLVEKISKRGNVQHRIGIPGINLCDRAQSTKNPKEIQGHVKYQQNCQKTLDDFPGAGPGSAGNIMYGFCGALNYPTTNTEGERVDTPWQWNYIEAALWPMTPDEFLKEAVEQMYKFTGVPGWSGPRGEGKRMQYAKIVVRLRLWPQIVMRSKLEGEGIAYALNSDAADTRLSPDATALEREQQEKRRAEVLATTGENNPFLDLSDEELTSRLEEFAGEALKRRGTHGSVAEFLNLVDLGVQRDIEVAKKWAPTAALAKRQLEEEPPEAGAL